MADETSNVRPIWPGFGVGFVIRLDPAVAAPQALLHVKGALDLATAPLLLDSIRDVADSGRRQVVLDLADVEFCDGAGFEALVTGREWLRDVDGTLTVHDPCWSLTRIMDIFDVPHTDRRMSRTGPTPLVMCPATQPAPESVMDRSP